MTDVTIGSGLQAADDAPALKVRGYWHTVGYRLRYDYVTLFFALVIVLIALAAVCAPLLAPFDPFKTSMAYRLKPIGFRSFALGTDELGRDMLSRLHLRRAHVAADGAHAGAAGDDAGRHARRDRRLRRRQRQHADHAHDRHVLRLPLGAAGRGDLRHDGRRHEQRPDRADAGVHPAAVPRRRDRDHAGAQPRLRRGRTRQRRADPVDHRASRARQRAGAGLHLRLEPDLGRRSCWRRACRSSASASSRRHPTGA